MSIFQERELYFYLTLNNNQINSVSIRNLNVRGTSVIKGKDEEIVLLGFGVGKPWLGLFASFSFSSEVDCKVLH